MLWISFRALSCFSFSFRLWIRPIESNSLACSSVFLSSSLADRSVRETSCFLRSADSAEADWRRPLRPTSSASLALSSLRSLSSRLALSARCSVTVTPGEPAASPPVAKGLASSKPETLLLSSSIWPSSR